MNIGDTIRAKAIEILAQEPAGIRWVELLRRVGAEMNMGPNQLKGALSVLDDKRPEEVYKPVRGVFRLLKFKPTEEERDIVAAQVPAEAVAARVHEEDFYAPFADWIKDELEECTKAISLGGNKFRDKFGTPDLNGIRKPKEGDIIKPPTEIVSAEIKIDGNALITAFGQACSYRLFSHKSYLVVPGDAPEEDLARWDALSRICGIGLILFDAKAPDKPDFQIRARAAKQEPDMFYVNRNMKLIETELFG
ncbi:MAG TPA: hypothetical protein VLV88_13690 [Terriglobales bacterium]|nr:hypothetical protein [Terriglobales bacterium]